jgi:hypothetical protein
LEAQVG